MQIPEMLEPKRQPSPPFTLVVDLEDHVRAPQGLLIKVVLVLVVEVTVQDSVEAVDGLLILAFVGHLILALVGQ